MEVEASNIEVLLGCPKPGAIKYETDNYLFETDLWKLSPEKLDEILVPRNPSNDSKNNMGNTNMEEIKINGLAGKKDSSGTKCCSSKIEKLVLQVRVALLQSTNIWAGNSGVSVHCINDRTQGINIHERSSVGTASSIMDINRIWCNQFGKEQLKAILKDVQYNPKSNFDLFCIRKAIKEEWKLSHDQEGLVPTKNSVKLVFNVKITTK